MLREARLAFHTARHMSAAQLARRLRVAVERRLGRVAHPPVLPAVPGGLVGRLAPALPFASFRPRDPWNRREALLEGRFRFLEDEAELGRPVAWEAPGKPLLWQYNLHYFDYLALLRPEEQLELCRDWIAHNPPSRTGGWYPYPTSLRIINWCKAGLTEPDLLESLYRQAAYLRRNLETYAVGNHVLENARALIFAGRFLEAQGEAADWLATGLALFREQTPAQVLADGGYFERSPMYHAIMLEAYLDVLNVLPADHPDRPLLTDTVERMSDFLVSVIHPNGELALFNDSTLEIARPAAELVEYTRSLTGHEPRPGSSFPETGYFTHAGPELHLIVDGGPIAPEHVGAHAHADIFSYELSLGKQQMVVDSGVFQYEAGEMRSYVRSTRAHNTVCVDGVDQAECWHAFQLGRRYPPRDVEFRLAEGRSEFRGRFDGYARLIGDRIVHRRELRCDEGGREIRVRDEVEGGGRHRVESLLHLHPDVELEPREGGFELARGGIRGTLEVLRGAASVERGWYCPRFGVRRPNDVVVVTADGPLPARIEYAIRF